MSCWNWFRIDVTLASLSSSWPIYRTPTSGKWPSIMGRRRACSNSVRRLKSCIAPFRQRLHPLNRRT